MGTRFSPSFANIYMGDFKTEFIYNEQPWSKNGIYYMRYIDDLLFIWDGSEK